MTIRRYLRSLDWVSVCETCGRVGDRSCRAARLRSMAVDHIVARGLR